jgi:16S rRNA (guanine966-N2)-methyltransferase
MTRVIAGSARGRRLAVPASGTRPTADRVREAVFSAVTSALGSLGGARVLDLYAGSGAVGIEALSRGAGHALLVESDRKALEVLRTNLATVGLPGGVALGGDVSRITSAAPPPGAQPPYDLVFADPPYDTADETLDAVVAGLAEHGWLADGALVLLERPRRRTATTWPAGFEVGKERTYGETVVRSALWYGREA